MYTIHVPVTAHTIYRPLARMSKLKVMGYREVGMTSYKLWPLSFSVNMQELLTNIKTIVF